MSDAANLRTSLGLALLIHSFSFFIFQVKIEPGRPIFSYQNSRISFLGAILDDDSFRIVTLPESTQEPSAKFFYPKELLKAVIVSTGQSHFHQTTPFLNASLDDWSHTRGEGYSSSVGRIYPQNEILRIHESPPILFEGDIKERPLLYQPELLELFKGEDQPPDFFQVALRFIVSTEGFVEQIEPVLSSGDPELDRIGVYYLTGCRFVPADSKNSGLVKIHFSKKQG